MVLWGTWLTLSHLRRRPAERKLEPISILKPLKGLDFQLEENLESFFRLEYPSFELLLSVASESDPAYAVVKHVMTKFPRVRASVYVGDVGIGLNPKVNNLIKSYQSARNDWILISDSNIRVSPKYLDAMVEPFDERTGVVTAVVTGQYLGKGFGAPLEATYLNTFYARWMLIAWMFGTPVVIGKSMLFRKSQANRFGGVELLGRYLAEDFMAGQAMKMLGLSIKIMREPTVQIIGSYPLKEFWQRHVRWGRIRKSQSPLTFPIEPLLSFWISGALGAYALSYFSLISFWPALVLHAAIWFLSDLAQMWCFNEKPTPKNIIAWLVRETIFVPLWVHIACGRSVSWRGAKFKLQRGGLLES